MNQTVNAHLNASTPHAILEGVYPVAIDLRRPNKHGHGVVYGLHVSSVPMSVGHAIRLFGKPGAFERRRMGVALAEGRDTDEARQKAEESAGRVKPTQ